MKKAICMLFVMAVFLFAAETSYACSCFASPAPIKKQVADAYKGSSAIFSGKVLSIEQAPGDGSNVLVKFEVAKTWKGSKGKEIVVSTEKDSAMCGYNFEVGKEYVVYAGGAEEALSTNNCSRTGMSSQNGDVKYLNALMKKKKKR